MLGALTVYNRIRQNKYAPLVFTLLVFLCIRLISLFVFYNGFTINFSKINSYFNSSFIEAILSYVPYHHFSICLSAFLHPLFLIGFVLIIRPILKYKKEIAAFSFSQSERLLVTFSAALLSWELCTYNYNYYLDNAFYLDRILLAIFPFLLWRMPFLSPVYITIALVYRSQFNYPIEGFDLFDKRLLFDILILFTAITYSKIYFKGRTPDFVQLVLCIVASNYFATGVSKIFMSPQGYEWLLQNKLSDFFLNAHQRGWMFNVSDDTIHSINSVLDNGDFVFKLSTLFIEISAFCILISRRWAILGLIAFILLHIGIFLAGSMLFWKWMAIDALLIYILLNKTFDTSFYSVKTFKVSLIIIVSSFIWLRPYPIGWFDTCINQFFTYEAIDDRGHTAAIHKNDFDPYHQWIQYDKFLRLVNENTLPVSGFGYTHDYNIQRELANLQPDSILSYIHKKGVNSYSPTWKVRYDAFMKQYFDTRNSRGEQLAFLKYIRAPHHLYNRDSGEGIHSLGKIKKLRVYFNITHNLSGVSHSLIKRPIDEIII